MKKLLTLALSIALVLSFLTIPVIADEAEKPQYEVTYVSVWAGSSANFPTDVKNNPVADIIREKFGLSFTFEGITTSETEYLNMMFAAGTTPDMVNAPYWGTTGGEGYVIAKAASEGQVKELTDILKDYPEILDNYLTYAGPATKKYMLQDARYDGGIYVIPRDIAVVPKEDYTLYADAMYARKDILDALDVKPEDVTNMDQLYDLLVKVKNSGLTDWNGEALIPMGTNHNGWRQENIYGWMQGDFMSSYRLQEDGSVKHWVFDSLIEDRVLYMRKLVSEGLIDVECFTQNNSLAQEKYAQGKVAVSPIDANLAAQLYQDYSQPDHLEAEWVLLGMRSATGNPTVDVYQDGLWTGGGVFFFSPNIDEAKLKVLLDFMVWQQTTEEGILLVKYGIENEDYTMANGYPEQTEAFKAALANDAKYANDRGINQYRMVMLDMSGTWWAVPDSAKSERDQMMIALQDSVRWARDEHTYAKISMDYIATEAPSYELFKDMSSGMDINATLQSAYFLGSDEEALAVIQECRDYLASAGVDEICAYLAENYDPENYMF